MTSRESPHAFLFACLMDRQVTAERAWTVPLLIRNAWAHLDLALGPLSEEQWVRLLREPSPAHRLPETMAVLHRAYTASHRALRRRRLTSGRVPSSATLVTSLLEFHGAGPKIATMTANILVRDFHVPLSDYRYIDISADTQVQRVMARLGFVRRVPTWMSSLCGRRLNPDFPGIFDFALWDIGRNSVQPTDPRCAGCRLSDLCAYALGEAIGWHQLDPATRSLSCSMVRSLSRHLDSLSSLGRFFGTSSR